MTAAPGFNSADHAVLLGLDGLSVRALEKAMAEGNAPRLRALRARGAFTDDARCTQPSLSLPNWASVLFGVPPAFHGVHAARLDEDVRPASLRAGATWPNVFAVARRAKGPHFTTAAYYSWPPLSQLLPRAYLNATLLAPCSNCDQCLRVEPSLVEDFATALRRRRFGLSWLYLDALDECGHARGANSPSYSAEVVRRVDGWVGQVVDALSSARMLDRTALLIMSDHGREARGYGHGGFTTSELAVQWLLVAPGVRPGVRLTSPVSIMDTVPTLLHALGVAPPAQVYGRVVREAYEPIGHSSSTPLWSLGVPESAAQMRATVGGGSGGGVASPLTSGWDGSSVLVGAIVGCALGVLAFLIASRYLRARQEAQLRAGCSRTLTSIHRCSGAFAGGAHPAANRLRAAAGTCSPDEEEFSPLVG